jgi:hypothetical protein
MPLRCRLYVVKREMVKTVAAGCDRRRSQSAATIFCVVIFFSIFPSFAQTYTQRGFLEGRGTLYPRRAVNDPAHTLGESVFRYEGFFTPSNTLQFAGGVDFRTDTHHQVERDFKLSWLDREIQRPLADVRRLSATLHSGPLTFEAGKQFIRWGKTDIVTPTDRFAPRDFITVVDSEFLAVTAARLNFEKGPNTLEAVWSPRFTPSRIPLADQRWAPPPPPPPSNIPVTIRDTRRSIPGGPQTGFRWNYAGPVEFGLSVYRGFNNLPSFAAVPVGFGPRGVAVDVNVFYPQMSMAGFDFAIPARLFTLKGEAAQFKSNDNRADDYGLYVIQLERQSGEWFFVGGYSGEAVTKHGSRVATFAPDRGLTRTFLGRAGYTFDANRSIAFETAVRQNGNGLWIKGEYSQLLGQHWRITLNVTGITGELDDFLGQYQLNYHGLLVVRYSF